MPNGSMESRALRQQLRTQLGQGIRDTEQVLSQYRAAYPSFDLVDWPAVQQHLAGQPVPGVNVHPEVEGPRSPAWIQEQTIEPIAFGSLADPVSQAAFLLAPGLLKGVKTGLEVAGSPGPRLGALAGERGNLGPVPRSQSGQPLPESAVRTETGELKRLYHGTTRAYPDFAESKFGSGAGGDLYGPGIYMTENPQIAGGGQGYATVNWPDLAREALTKLEKLHESHAYYTKMAGEARTLNESMHAMEQAKSVEGLIAQESARLQGHVEQAPWMFEAPPRPLGYVASKEAGLQQIQALPAGEQGQVELMYDTAVQSWFLRTKGGLSGANVRPVYADLKKPFDIEAPADAGLLKTLDEVGFDYYTKWGTNEPDIATNKDLYETLLRNLGDKAEVNDWLRANGYDGITHIGGRGGGQPHRVYIAFSPEHVYPSVNVEGGLPIPPQP